jgi:hypothetical protein
MKRFFFPRWKDAARHFPALATVICHPLNPAKHLFQPIRFGIQASLWR